MPGGAACAGRRRPRLGENVPPGPRRSTACAKDQTWRHLFFFASVVFVFVSRCLLFAWFLLVPGFFAVYIFLKLLCELFLYLFLLLLGVCVCVFLMVVFFL